MRHVHAKPYHKNSMGLKLLQLISRYITLDLGL